MVRIRASSAHSINHGQRHGYCLCAWKKIAFALPWQCTPIQWANRAGSLGRMNHQQRAGELWRPGQNLDEVGTRGKRHSSPGV